MTIVTCLGGCSWRAQPKLETIKTSFNIKVKNPVFRQLTLATEQFDIDATGEFAPGTYVLRGTPVTVEEGTTFHLSLKLPIKNPDVISTAAASGQFHTSKQLKARGVPLPLDIAIKDGRVTGEFDLVHMLGSFFINLLQSQALTPAEGSDVQQLLRSMHVDSARLSLRPDAKLTFGSNHMHTGPNSFIGLSNLTVDKNLDYRGSCQLNLHFSRNCAYVEPKVDALFNGGHIDETVAITRKNSILTLAPLLNRPAPKVTLSDCTYKFGRQKASSAHCDTSVITVTKFDWAVYEAGNLPSDFHFDTRMDLTGTKLSLRQPTFSVDAFFTETEPAQLGVYHEKQDRGLTFATHDVLARTASITIERPTTSIQLDLEQARLGTIEFSKSGDVDFQLSEGTSRLKAFQWSNGKKTFRLATSGGSTLAVTKGTPLALNTEHAGGSVQGRIPLSVKLGEASLSDANGNMLEFKKINGQVVVDVDKEVSLTGKAAISISQCQLLGDTPADVTVKGFRLHSGDGKAVMSLDGCTVVVPKGTLTEVLKKQMPEENAFSFNQEIFEEKKWRYKHAMITGLVVRHPVVDQISLVSSGKATFTAGGDVEVDGTVEKTGIYGVLIKNPQHWVTKDWKASSHCTGNGVITFKFIPSKTLADSDLSYDLSMQMPLPQDIEVDWHQVSSGLVQKAERSVISGYLNKCEPFHGTRTIPFNHKGSIKLFQAKSAALKTIRISNFTLRPTASGTEIHFIGEATL